MIKTVSLDFLQMFEDVKIIEVVIPVIGSLIGVVVGIFFGFIGQYFAFKLEVKKPLIQEKMKQLSNSKLFDEIVELSKLIIQVKENLIEKENYHNIEVALSRIKSFRNEYSLFLPKKITSTISRIDLLLSNREKLETKQIEKNIENLRSYLAEFMQFN